MIISGATVLAFLFVHMYDFWFHEMVYKYVEFSPEDPYAVLHGNRREISLSY